MNEDAASGVGWLRLTLRAAVWVPLSLLLVVCGLEMLFAVAHLGEEEYLKIDPSVGFLHLENKLITFRSEGFSQNRINSRGFRDIERAVHKPQGTKRIVFLGDSKTEAFQVPIGETFVSLIEQLLNRESKSSGLHYETMNFGMSAFSTLQEYVLFKNEVLKYKPDVCVLMYHVFDSDENIATGSDPGQLPRPYASVDERGTLVCDWSVMRSWLQGERARFYRDFDWLRRHSRIWGVYAQIEPILTSDKIGAKIHAGGAKAISALMRLARGVPSTREPQRDYLEPATGSDDGSPNPNALNYAPVNTIRAAAPAAREVQAMFNMHATRWPVTAAIIGELNKCCRAHDCKLVVAALPARDNSIFYFRELKYLKKQASTEGFTFLNLHELFPPLAPMEKSPLYLHKMHFSRAGHQLVATLIQHGLVQAKVLP